MPALARRSALIACALSVLVAAPVRAADPYPVKPIRIVVPYPAGGTTDQLARAIQQSLADDLGHHLR